MQKIFLMGLNIWWSWGKSILFFSLEKIVEPLTHSFCRVAVFFFPGVFFFSALTHSFWWSAVFFFSSCVFFSGISFLWPWIILWMYDESAPSFFSNWPPAPFRTKNKSRNLQISSWYLVLFFKWFKNHAQVQTVLVLKSF